MNMDNIVTTQWSKITNNKKKKKVPTAIFLMGLPASGKSTVINYVVEEILEENMEDYLHIDPDIFMKTIETYRNENAEDFNRMGVIISSKIMKKLYDTDSRYDFIYFGTGKNWEQYRTAINKAKKNGYFTVLVYVHVSREETKSRAGKRSKKGNNQRVVDNSVINKIYNSLTKKQEKGKYMGKNNYEILKSLKTLDYYIKIDNSKEYPVVIEYSR